MNWLYLSLDLTTLFFPLALSFDKNVRYYKAWKNSILAAVIISVPFLIWDYLFTHHGFWGFNPDYITGINVFHLPIEEILFFIVVPFACTFIYEVSKYLFRGYSQNILNKLIYFLIPLYGVVLVAIDANGYYTLAVLLSSGVVLVLMILNTELKYLSLAFLLSLIPFLMVNGVLTGTFIDNPVVWYSEAQKVQVRILTIPMEDILYSFTLVVSNMILFEKLQQKSAK